MIEEFRRVRETSIRLLLGGHCIESAANESVVVYYGDFSSPPEQCADGKCFAVMDAGEFAQLTVSLPADPQPSNGVFRLDAGKTSLYYSEGATAWYEKGAGSYGSSASGNIEARALGPDRWHVKADLEIDVTYVNERKAARRHVIIDEVFVEDSFNRLSKCLGHRTVCDR
jgi:hypothetical protein